MNKAQDFLLKYLIKCKEEGLEPLPEIQQYFEQHLKPMICLNLDQTSGETLKEKSATVSVEFFKLLTEEEILRACAYYKSIGIMPAVLQQWLEEKENETL